MLVTDKFTKRMTVITGHSIWNAQKWAMALLAVLNTGD